MFYVLLSVALAWPPTEPGPEEAAAARLGRVVQTFDAGGFTYLELRVDEALVWVAGPPTQVGVGDSVATTEGVEMAEFYSRTLDRTFPRIWFVAGVRVMGATPVGRAPYAVPTVPGGVTVGQVYARIAELGGTDVAITGRVVRSSEQILGRNWLHLQDGTGGEQTFDLPVTTSASVEVGAVVVVRGRLVADRDFGSGYRYPVLIEDAAVEVLERSRP